jgi:hypothetical protein
MGERSAILRNKFQGMDVVYEELDEGIVDRRILPILLRIELSIFHHCLERQLFCRWSLLATF